MKPKTTYSLPLLLFLYRNEVRMNLKIAICDDEERVRETLRNYLLTYSISNRHDFEIYDYSGGSELLNSYQKAHTFDIVFMDVLMDDDISGLVTAEKIRNLPDHDVKITFLSSYPKYMQDSFHVTAHNFMTKPIEYEDLKKEMDSIIKSLTELPKSIPVKVIKGDTVLVYINSLMYIQTERGLRGRTRLLFHTTDDVITAFGTIADYKQSLSDFHFAVPCKGFLVNFRFVHRIGISEIELTNHELLPLSKMHRKDIISKYAKSIIYFNS